MLNKKRYCTFDEDDAIEITDVGVEKLITDVRLGKVALVEALSLAWEAGWCGCATGGGSHHNPFGELDD